MAANIESELDDVFGRYKAACGDIEPSVNFMPVLWQKIEARHSFWFVFERLGKAAMTASAAVCLLLLVLNFVATPKDHLGPTYTDALMADHSAERTYYAEGILNLPSSHDTGVVAH